MPGLVGVKNCQKCLSGRVNRRCRLTDHLGGSFGVWGDWVEAVRGWGTCFLLEQVPKVLVFNELEITKIYEINI